MPDKCKIAVYKTNQLYVYGKDLRRIRFKNELYRTDVCRAMNRLGYAYYPVKLMRYEQRTKLYLSASEMISLISCLGGNFQLI